MPSYMCMQALRLDWEVEEWGCNGKGCSRGFSVPPGCSGRRLGLEGTVRSDSEAWTSLKTSREAVEEERAAAGVKVVVPG